MDPQEFFAYFYGRIARDTASQELKFDGHGKPIFAWGGATGRKPTRTFKSLGEMARERSRLGLRKVDVFDMSHGVSQLPHVGPEYYGGMEEIMRLIRENPKASKLVSSIEHWSFSTSKFGEFLPEFIRDGTQYGFFKPGDDKTSVLRLFNKAGKELPSSTIEELFGDLSQIFNTKDKLPKRLGPMFNVGPASLSGIGKETPFLLFDPQQLQGKVPLPGLVGAETAKDFYKSVVDGAGMINPALIQRHAQAQRQRAKDISADLRSRLAQTTDPRERAKIHREMADVKKLRDSAREFERMAKKGGSMEGFRLTGFSVDDLSALLGVDKPTAEAISKGGIKGDVLIPKNWDEALARFSRVMRTGKIDTNIGGIFSSAATTSGYGSSGGSGFSTLRPNHPTSIVRADIQSMSAFPDLYDSKAIYSTQSKLFQKELETIKSTGSISPAYEDSLRKLVALSDSARDGAQQDMKTWKGLGVTDRADLENKASRARRILAAKDAGATLFEDKHLLKEVLSSLGDTIRGPAAHAGEPRFIMPSAFRAHVNTSFWSNVTDGVEVTPGTMLFKNGRFVFNESDYFSLIRAHGGWDQDDSLAAHLRFYAGDSDRAAGLYSVNFRSPGGLGEISALKFDLQNSDPKALLHLSESNNRLASYIDNFGVELPSGDVLGFGKTLSEIERLEKLVPELQARFTSLPFGDRSLPGVQEERDKAITKLNMLTREVENFMWEIDDQADRLFPEISGRQLKYFQSIQEAARVGDLEGMTSGFAKYWTEGDKSFGSGEDSIALARTEFNAGRLTQVELENVIARENRISIMTNEWGQSTDALDDVAQIRRLLDGAVDRGAIAGAQIEEILKLGPSAGALGKYANIRAIADNTIRSMQMMEADGLLANAGDMKGIFRATEMESIIDLLVQLDSADLDIGEVHSRTMGLLHGVAEAASKGVKLDPALFEGRKSGFKDAFMYALRDINPDIDPESIWLDLADPDQRKYSWVSTLSEMNQRMLTELESQGNVLLDQASPTRKEIMNQLFEPKEYDDAKLLRQSIDEARVEWGSLSESLKAQALSDYDEAFDSGFWDNMESWFVRQRFQQQFGSYFEDAAEGTVMGSRAVGALGAFMQQHGESYGTVISSDDFSRVRQIVEESLVNQTHGPLSPISGLSMGAELPAGMGKKILAEEDFEAGKAISEGGKHIGDIGRLTRGLWDNGLFRKGVLFGGAALVGSLIYQSTKDISPENLGGGFYDSQVTMSPEQSIPPMQTGSSAGGTTYRINANGNHDPDRLAMMSGNIVGGPVSSSVYSRGRYNPRATNDQIDKSF